jgi:hypothetical protein
MLVNNRSEGILASLQSETAQQFRIGSISAWRRSRQPPQVLDHRVLLTTHHSSIPSFFPGLHDTSG